MPASRSAPAGWSPRCGARTSCPCTRTRSARPRWPRRRSTPSTFPEAPEEAGATERAAPAALPSAFIRRGDLRHGADAADQEGSGETDAGGNEVERAIAAVPVDQRRGDDRREHLRQG